MLELGFRADPEAASPGGGSAIWVELPSGVDSQALAAEASARGIAYARGELFRVPSEGPPALLLSFASAPDAAIREGVAELAAPVRRQRIPGSRR